ncbi:hypothetical protein NUBL21976_43410 [Klebsiella pneumoniae]|nr:hypothetical protein NUBL21976_43410 [Klebsiella pneumoniae]
MTYKFVIFRISFHNVGLLIRLSTPELSVHEKIHPVAKSATVNKVQAVVGKVMINSR